VLLTNATALRAQTTIAARSVHTIAPDGLPCLTNETIVADNSSLSIRKGCNGARSMRLIETGVTFF
jgi:hypothetical protein